MRVVVKLLATVDVDARSPDEAIALVHAALCDAQAAVETKDGPWPMHVGLLDAHECPEVIGEGEDPAPDH